ncbi:MAG: beta-ketoacyl-ACP synthase II [Verrucomicrobiota bacterium]
MTERRVVITGMGVISPVGNDVATFWANLTAGRSGIGKVTQFDTTGYACRIGGEVRDFSYEPFFKTPREARRVDRYAGLGVAAAKMALDDCGVDVKTVDPTRWGVMVGSGIGGLATHEEQHTKLMQKGPDRVSPFTIPMMISNIGSGIISMEHGFTGPNMVIVTACATGNNNIGEAWRMIKFGDADAFLAGGAEATILPMGYAGFGNMRALSTRNDEPERASRPFDRNRDGFVMGEGAGVMVIEELEYAKKRGARIYAEIVGYGVSADAYHLSAPNPEGLHVSRCMDMALRHAKLNPEDVQYVNAHATSTPMGDICETKAIKKTFGNWAKEGLVISATKSMTGHLLGAAGAVELAASVLSIRDGLIAPTINLEDPDDECDLDYTANVAREKKIDVAMSNGFGFGGHNATVVIRRFDG